MEWPLIFYVSVKESMVVRRIWHHFSCCSVLMTRGFSFPVIWLKCTEVVRQHIPSYSQTSPKETWEHVSSSSWKKNLFHVFSFIYREVIPTENHGDLGILEKFTANISPIFNFKQVLQVLPQVCSILHQYFWNILRTTWIPQFYYFETIHCQVLTLTYTEGYGNRIQ